MIVPVAVSLVGMSSKAEAKVPLAKFSNGSMVKLEVASSPEAITRGLMYRTSMPEDSGMVFLFHPMRAVNFWMYHTLMPLDMLFIRDGSIVKLFENVPPCKSENPEDCPRYPSGAGIQVSEVIELNGGYAKRHGLKEGDTVTFELP
jgi:hypothetical protein